MIEKLNKLVDNMNNDHISESSAQCAYYTILSFIPFLILLITLIQYTGIEPKTLFDAISKIIPSSMNEMVLNIVQEVYSKSIGTISISIIFTIWSAGRGLYALTKGLQKVYNTDDKENASYLYLRVKAIIETILFIILIVIGLTGLVFGDALRDTILQYIGKVEEILVEDVNLKKAGYVMGRTESGRLVNFKGGSDLVGKFINVKINTSKSAALWGEKND